MIKLRYNLETGEKIKENKKIIIEQHRSILLDKAEYYDNAAKEDDREKIRERTFLKILNGDIPEGTCKEHIEINVDEQIALMKRATQDLGTFPYFPDSLLNAIVHCKIGEGEGEGEGEK